MSLFLIFVLFGTTVNCATVNYHNERTNNLRSRFSGDENFEEPEGTNNDYYDFSWSDEKKDDSLLMVNVLFRHGNRTADSQAELYPNDPYREYEYFPYGLGQLTRAGKLREYSIGTALRNRYNHFLGEHYYPDIVEARSTDYNRTKMSLQLVLAGLFPPRKDDVFADQLDFWQPVPYNYVPRNQDYLLLGNLCPRYEDMYRKYLLTKNVQKQLKYFKNLFSYITRHSGKNITKFQDVYDMYFGISTESEYGLDLPSWLKLVWPKQIVTMSVKEYHVSMGTNDMRKILAGYLLDKMINDAKKKLIDSKEHGRKIYLYSAHENNIAQLLIALGVFDDTIPNYGSYVVLELHRVNGVPGIKVLYENYYGGGPKVLTIPGCDAICPLPKFELLMAPILPKPTDQLC